MNYLLRVLNVRRNEVPRLLLASAVFFLAQVDDGIVKSVSSAVFNVRAGVEKLPLMYTWIAVVFSLSMAFLSWLTSKVARQRLLLGLMVFVASILTANALLLLYEHRIAVGLGMQAYSFLFISSELARTLMKMRRMTMACSYMMVLHARRSAASPTFGQTHSIAAAASHAHYLMQPDRILPSASRYLVHS